MNDTSHISLTPLLKWDSFEVNCKYNLQLDTSENFTTPLIDTSGIDTIQYQIRGSLLKSRTNYYWRVAAVDSNSVSAWSNVYKFTTGLFPVLITPAENATINTDTETTFIWKDMNFASGFRIQISLDSLFSITFIDRDNITATQMQFPINTFKTDSTYYWRVLAHLGSNDSSDWSTPWKFKDTTIISGIEQDKNITLTKFGICQNYPNPFNPSTNIKFDIPKELNVKITVYNILGKEVAIILNKELRTGSYEVNFDANNLASGIYFYRIQAGDFISVKKMILIK